MRSLRKQAANYCFLDDCDIPLFPTKDEKTPKNVLLDDVKSSFLSCIKNNKKECDLNSDMVLLWCYSVVIVIFIPLHLADHFSCLCINVIKHNVEYLDNVYKKVLFYGKDSELGMYCHTVLNIMSDSLLKMAFPEGRSRKRGKANDGLCCSLDCGGEDNQILLVSVFMRKNQKLLSKMLKLRKQVVDLCFLDDFTLSLTKDIMSILPGISMSTREVDCWFTLLISLEFEQRSEPSTMFFELRHMSTYLLDNILYNENDYSDMFKVTEIVGNHISLYLKMKNNIKESDCGQFEVRDVKFDWKKKEPNNDESDCFILYNMAQYEGTEFKSELGLKVSREATVLK
ncbi:hypothetical protein KSS87_023642 [Heliosperma pusillum]|nr:hypothetical protein KSS87_023642 [Heliosperma pusillum]